MYFALIKASDKCNCKYTVVNANTATYKGRVANVVVLSSRAYGDAHHCRKALHRAVQCSSDYPEHVCEVLLTFERVEGKWHKENNATT